MSHAEIRPRQQFELFPGDRGGDGPLSGHLLVQVEDCGQVGDHFRVALTGGSRLTATFNANLLLSDPGLGHFEATVDKPPTDIKFKTNSTVSKWENLEDLVSAESVLVSTDESEDAEEEFRAAWRAASSGDTKPAAALRWSLQADVDHGFDVVLQAMPASARSMRGDARLMADSCRTIELARWPATSLMTADRKSPKPLLFADDPAAATSAFAKRPARLEKGKKQAEL